MVQLSVELLSTLAVVSVPVAPLVVLLRSTVTFRQDAVGAITSCTVTTAVHVRVLLPSDTFRVTVLAPRLAQVKVAGTGVNVSEQLSVEPLSSRDPGIVTVPSEFSCAAAFLHLATGGTGSLIVTAKVQLLELPAASNARYTTVVTPTLNLSGLGNSVPLSVVAPEVAYVTAETEQLSPAVGITRFRILEQESGSVSAVWFVGQPVIVGFWVSLTVIDRVQ